MTRFRFSRRAEADLAEIGDYIARNNQEREVSFVTELRRHCRTMVAFPEAHALRADLGTGVRMAVHGKYLVRDNVLEIRRVVHGARNLP